MSEIKTDKILVKNLFENMWFRIPEYQRPYLWGRDQINDLLDDLSYAMQNKPDSEYFLGSLVFQTKPANPTEGQPFEEKDLLDGQQRLTTLLLIFSVIRSLSTDPDAKSNCQQLIFQKANKYQRIPERTRIVFSIRKQAQEFIEKYINSESGLKDIEKEIDKLSDKHDVSVENMANAVLEIKKYFEDNPNYQPEDLLLFILNYVLLIYVATEDMEDAFRLFTILNNRGIPLRNSDILKSINLGNVSSSKEKEKYAKMWEDAEGELGEDFERFLNYLRTILLKEKARASLLKEFEERIYHPKETDQSTGKPKKPLLSKGANTFLLIERYLEHYNDIMNGQDRFTNNFQFHNLIQVMKNGLPSTDWVAPLLRYYDKYGPDDIFVFLTKLDNKFSTDWIVQDTATKRVEAMNRIIRQIDETRDNQKLFKSDCFNFDSDGFKRIVEGSVYSRPFARYLLLKLDYFYQNHDQKMNLETISIEHILPQNPADNSMWMKDFSQDQRLAMTHKLGNLVIITRRKNTSQGRQDYITKKENYFKKNIDTCPNSLRVLNKYPQWTPKELEDNQNTVISMLYTHYGV
jgi:uncharacterized protein with ParB-like and HNH nuclease domain